MAVPFATASDLANRLKVPLWSGEELLQVEEHLADASEDLRQEIGWQVYPPAEITVPAVRDHLGRLVVPGVPQGALTEGEALDGTPTVTYTVGYTEPPRALVKWTCVLAAQSLARAADEQLGGGTPSSETLADYRISYSERQQLGELPIPQRVLERLRSTYGQAVYAT